MSADIVSAGALLKRNLEIPNYQRPYKWSTASVSSLLEDIDAAINISKHIDGYKYRIGTVILHCGCDDEEAITACAKASTFKDMIDKGSPKLRLMRDNTHSEEDWRNKECEKHGEEMLKLLKEACFGTVYNG